MQSDEDFQNDSPPIESGAPAVEATISPDNSGDSKGEQPKETLYDAIQEVVKATSVDGEDALEGKEEPPTSEDAEETGKAEEPEEARDETDEEIAADKDDVSPKAGKRIRRLLKDRTELRNEVAHLRAPAEIGSQLENFTKTHDLSGDDVVNALHIAATLRRGDMRAFYEMVSPYVRHAQEYLGVVLPDDLQSLVHQGQMSENVAREFAKTRFDQQRVQIENQRMNDLGQRYVTQEVQGNVARAVSDFENQLAASDPDYKGKKAGFVQREAYAILQEQYGGQVKSIEEAISVVKAAYNNVNSQLKKMAPAPKATARTPSGSLSQTPATRTAPKSLMEAVVAGLHSSRAG